MRVCFKRDLLLFKRLRGYILPTLRHCPLTDDRWKIEMQALSTDVRNRVMTLVKAILEQNAINATIDPDTRLVDVGLTSMDMVNLMLGVEAEFDFTIPQSEITPENFQSVKTLESMIAGQLQQAA
jgi:acyl carrier protein